MFVVHQTIHASAHVTISLVIQRLRDATGFLPLWCSFCHWREKGNENKDQGGCHAWEKTHGARSLSLWVLTKQTLVSMEQRFWWASMTMCSSPGLRGEYPACLITPAKTQQNHKTNVALKELQKVKDIKFYWKIIWSYWIPTDRIK